jgi:hypothetical protein
MPITVIALIVGAVVVVLIIVAAVVVSRQKSQKTGELSYTRAPEPAAAPAAPQAAPQPATPAPQAPAAPPPAPVPPAAAPAPAAPAKPPTLMVEALAPSETGMAPMLAEPSLEPAMDEIKMGTDELPRVGTGQVPALADAPAGRGRYRTPAAQQLADAIESMTCPKCKAPTFVGKETPEEVGADGSGMFRLEARCGACGHRANLIDMRVG